MPMKLDTELVWDILTPGNFSRLETLLADLRHVSGLDSLFRRGLGTVDPDEPILAVFAELAGLHYLVERGCTEIEVEAMAEGKTAEFTAQRDGVPCVIEVKSLQKEESQNQLGTILGGVYVFAPGRSPGPTGDDADVGTRNTAVVHKLIRRKVRDAMKQIEETAARKGLSDWRGVAIVVTTRQRRDLSFWDDICFEALKQACNELIVERPRAKLGTGVFISSGGAQIHDVA